MLRRDLIMVQIEELGKVIAQIISQRNTNAARKISALIQTVYNSLKLDLNRLLECSVKQIFDLLNTEDGAGLQRMEIAAKLLIEESYLYPEKEKEIRLKAKDILTYIHTNTRHHFLIGKG